MRPVLSLYAIFLFIGCSKLNNSVDELSAECSVPIRSQEHYLKIHTADAQIVEGEAVKRLQSVFVSDLGIKTTLPMTANGCIAIPAETGVLSVVDAVTKQSLTQKIDPPTFQDPSVTKVYLQTLKDFALSLNCPIEGLFADESLSSPETLALNGDLNGLEFRLDLYSSGNRFLRQIYKKHLGESHIEVNRSISVSDLPEGAYDLKLYGRHVANGIEAAPALLNPDKACALHILHGDVKVKGIDRTSLSVVAKGSSLNWKPEKSGGKLYICREARHDCQPKVCHSADNFESTDEVIASETGAFDYHVFAKDQLGRKSPMSCQTVIVSDSRPSLSVEWEAEDLKVQGSVLRIPYATLKAQIQLDHALVDQPILKSNLECKVSFEIKGRDQLSGNGVFCTEGRCKGMPMGQFVPCDEQIGLSLVEAWEQPMIATSRLLLTVRSSDGAGHVVESETSLWINKSIWTTDVLDFQINGEPWSVRSLAMSKSGIPVGVFSDHNGTTQIAARYIKGQWEPYPQIKSLSFFNIQQRNDGNLSVLAFYRDIDDQARLEYLQLDDEGLIKKQRDLGPNFNYGCSAFTVDSTNRLWCSNRTTFVYFKDGSWHSLPDMSAVLEPSDDAHFLERWLVGSDGKLLFIGKDFILIHEDGLGWRRLNVRSELKKNQLVAISEDYKGRIWLTSRDSENHVNSSLFLLKDGHLKEYPSPHSLNGRVHYSDPAVQPTGIRRLQLGFQIFDFSTDTWARLDYDLDLSEEMGEPESIRLGNETSVLSLNNHGFFEKSTELLYWPIKALGFSCACSPTVHKAGQEFYFIANGEKSQVVRLKINRSSRFDGRMLNFQGSYAVDSWMDSQGRAIFAMENGSLLEFSGDKVQKRITRLPKTPIRVYPLSDDRYCVSTLKNVLVVDQNSTTRVVYEGEGSSYYFDCGEDAQGRIWFASDAVGYVDSNKVFHPLFDVDDERTGHMHTMRMLEQGRRIWTVSSKVIRIISTDTDAVEELTIEQLFPNMMITEIVTSGQISAHEMAIHCLDTNGKHYNFIYDLTTRRAVEDVSLMELDPKYIVAAAKFIGTKAWSHSWGSDGKYALLTRKNGRWTRVFMDELKPWPEVPGPAIQWAPDLAGRIWYMSNYPNYEFFRYDP